MTISTLLRVRTVLIIIVLFMIISAPVSHADIGSYRKILPPASGAPYPMKNEHIILNKVVVTINSSPAQNQINAKCEFDFKNTSWFGQEVVMGFPVAFVGGESNMSFWRIKSFKVWTGRDKPKLVLDGKQSNKQKDNDTGSPYDWILDYYTNINKNADNRLQIYKPADGRDKAKDGQDNIFTTTIFWNYEFAAREEQHFIVEYEASGWNDLHYIIGTAGSWLGNVGDMSIYVKYPCKFPLHEFDVSPGNYDYQGNMISWHFINYKPRANESVNVKVLSNCKEYDAAAIPKDYFAPRHVEDINYEMDKKFIKYQLTDRDEYNPGMESEESGWCKVTVKSPQYVKQEAAMLRNEIYARHGYVFATPKYKKCFYSKSWYSENKKFTESMLNYAEKRNVSYLKCIEDTTAKFPKQFSDYFEKFGAHTYGHACIDTDAVSMTTLTYNCDTHKTFYGVSSEPIDDGYFEYEKAYLSAIEKCNDN